MLRQSHTIVERVEQTHPPSSRGRRRDLCQVRLAGVVCDTTSKTGQESASQQHSKIMSQTGDECTNDQECIADEHSISTTELIGDDGCAKEAADTSDSVNSLRLSV
jgi:hypothetical protein